MPSMATTLSASGRRSSWPGSSRSQRTGSTPWARRRSASPGLEKRATPTTRRRTPAASEARRAMRASVGPILPPTPSTTRSPSSRPSVSVTPAVGSLSSSSRCSTSRIEPHASAACPIHTPPRPGPGVLRLRRRGATVRGRRARRGIAVGANIDEARKQRWRAIACGPRMTFGRPGGITMWAKIAAKLRRLWWAIAGEPKLTVERILAEYLGPHFRDLETHEKSFPGYDVASLHRALASFRDDCAFDFREVGSTPANTLRYLFSLLDSPYHRNLMPGAPVYQRVPVDVDEEGSFKTNCLYLATLEEAAGGDPSADDPEMIAILLAATTTGKEYWDGMDTHNVPHQEVTISIAARERAVA